MNEVSDSSSLKCSGDSGSGLQPEERPKDKAQPRCLQTPGAQNDDAQGDDALSVLNDQIL